MGNIIIFTFFVLPMLIALIQYLHTFITYPDLVWNDIKQGFKNLISIIVFIVLFIAPFFALYFVIDWFLKRKRQKKKAERDRKFEEVLSGLKKFGEDDYFD